MSAHAFRDHLKASLRAAGITQKQLARELALHPTVLSHKLNQTDGMSLSAAEVKRIVTLLADWQAITRRADAVALLRLMQLPPEVFSAEDWAAPPLSQLDDDLRKVPEAPKPQPVSSLPVPMTPLIGRDALVNHIRSMLDGSNARLLTLTGTGGVGKTRLAIEIGRLAADSFSDGAAFVSLTSLSDPALVAYEIAHQLKLKPKDPDSALDTLKEQLAPQTRLLILDNFEHLLTAAPLTTGLLDAAPGLRILVTSRTVLNLPGEQVIPVPPLDLPDVRGSTDAADLLEQPAISLLVARARAVRSQFELTESNLRALARICVRLDGLPLALELAAARLQLFSPQRLLERLDEPLSVLTHAPRDATPHQRTLNDTIAWSYNLLSADEQRTFLAISYFPGGASAEALEAVLDSSFSLSDLVASLLDKSLIRQDTGLDQQVRLTMLQTLRAYALAQAASDQAIQPVLERQIAYYRQLVSDHAAQLSGKNQMSSLNLLEAELDNLREVLARTITGTHPACMAILGSISQFWGLRGYAGEGMRWLSLAFAQDWSGVPDPQFQRDYGLALNGGGVMAFITGDYEQARVWFEGAVAIRRDIDDLEGLASTYNNLGNLAWNQSALLRARDYFLEAEQLARQIGNGRLRGSALNNLGAMYQTMGDLAAAEGYLMQALTIWQELENKQSLANALSNLGRIATARGRFEQASSYFAQSLPLMREIGNRRNEAAVLSNMAEVELQSERYDEARRMFEETLNLQRNVDYLWGVGSALCDLGRTAYHLQEYGTALARLNEAFAVLRQLGDQEKVAQVLEYLGLTTLQSNDHEGAMRYLRDALALDVAQDNLNHAAATLTSVALVYAQRGGYSDAVRFWSAAHHLWQTIDRNPLPAQRRIFEGALASVRARLDAGTYAEAWESGSALDASAALRLISD